MQKEIELIPNNELIARLITIAMSNLPVTESEFKRASEVVKNPQKYTVLSVFSATIIAARKLAEADFIKDIEYEKKSKGE